MKFILPIFLSSAAFAQVGGPFLGYAPEGTHLRPMYGLPAAGAIGSPIASRAFSHIALPPQQYFAVVSTSDTGEVLIAQEVKTGGFAFTSIPGASANPDLLAVSPGGASAALWFSASGHLQTVTGLPNSPSLRDIDASFLNAAPSAIAMSDDGQWAVGLFSSGVYAFGPSAQVIPLQTGAGVLALSFFHNSHNLALATAARATSIADIGGANQASILYDYSAQSLSPRAMAISFDNQHAVIADPSGKLVNLNIQTAAADIVDCGCSPTGVYSLGGSIFRLNNASGPERNALERGGSRPDLKVFDAAAGAVWIVPPALVETGGRP
jgi:hypothetical protein